jgi:hypothetical protein
MSTLKRSKREPASEEAWAKPDMPIAIGPPQWRGKVWPFKDGTAAPRDQSHCSRLSALSVCGLPLAGANFVRLGHCGAGHPELLSARFPPRPFEPCDALGRSQVVRQRILIPPSGGSNPPAPASAFKMTYINDLGVVRRAILPNPLSNTALLRDRNRLLAQGHTGKSFRFDQNGSDSKSTGKKIRMLSTICSCSINQQTRSAITGRHGPRARAKPENPLSGRAMAAHQSFYNRHMLTRNRHVRSVVAVGRHSQGRSWPNGLHTPG